MWKHTTISPLSVQFLVGYRIPKLPALEEGSQTQFAHNGLTVPQTPVYSSERTTCTPARLELEIAEGCELAASSSLVVTLY